MSNKACNVFIKSFRNCRVDNIYYKNWFAFLKCFLIGKHFRNKKETREYHIKRNAYNEGYANGKYEGFEEGLKHKVGFDNIIWKI